MHLLQSLRAALRRKDDLSEELKSHLQMAIADRIARGESPAEARRAATREFGNVALIADVTRERWGWLRLERLDNTCRAHNRRSGFHSRGSSAAFHAVRGHAFRSRQLLRGRCPLVDYYVHFRRIASPSRRIGRTHSGTSRGMSLVTRDGEQASGPRPWHAWRERSKLPGQPATGPEPRRQT